jgi:hypothetical protein
MANITVVGVGNYDLRRTAAMGCTYRGIGRGYAGEGTR